MSRVPKEDEEKYIKLKKIDKGSYGEAYLVQSTLTSKLLVIKSISLEGLSSSERKDVFQEAKILKSLNHSNIISLKEVFQQSIPKPALNLVMEYADGGDLYNVINEYIGKNMSIPEEQVLDWFIQICLGIRYIHNKKILHRDLKTKNVFLTSSGIIKIGDFGISKYLLNTIDKANTFIGTPFYLSPEIISNQPYSFKSDIWSLGVILYELCNLKVPFNGNSLRSLSNNILLGKYDRINKNYSFEMRMLIDEMLNLIPAKRPNIDVILNKKIIKNRINSFLVEVDIDDRQVKEINEIINMNLVKKKSCLVEMKEKEKNSNLKIEIMKSKTDDLSHNEKTNLKVENMKYKHEKVRRSVNENIDNYEKPIKNSEFSGLACYLNQSIKEQGESKEKGKEIETQSQVNKNLKDYIKINKIKFNSIGKESESKLEVSKKDSKSKITINPDSIGNTNSKKKTNQIEEKENELEIKNNYLEDGSQKEFKKTMKMINELIQIKESENYIFSSENEVNTDDSNSDLKSKSKIFFEENNSDKEINKINSFDTENTSEESLKKLIGKNIYNSIKEIIYKNTPDDYFYYDEQLLVKIIKEEMYEYKESLVEKGIELIKEIYSLYVFPQKERLFKITGFPLKN